MDAQGSLVYSINFVTGVTYVLVYTINVFFFPQGAATMRVYRVLRSHRVVAN